MTAERPAAGMIAASDPILDIVRPEPQPERRYSVARLFATPAFWRGAADARAALYERDPSLLTGRGIVRAQIIEQKVAAGCPLSECPEFAEWLRPGGAI